METRVEPQLGRESAPALQQRPRAPEKTPGSSLLRYLLWLLLAGAAAAPLTVLALRWLPPPFTAFMLQSEVKPVRYQWVPAERIAESARRAVVVSEDQKFWTHSGFDLEAMEKAYEHNQKSRRRRGASTISQQTVKNLFLWPGGGYFRKGVEALLTMLVEMLWGKQRILEVYLNIAEFGPGIYGVEAAANAYFHKPAAQLSAAEAAQLAAVLPNPRRWSARAPGPYVQSRVNWILGQMGYGRRTTPEQEPEPPPELAPTEEAPAANTAPQSYDASPEPPEPSQSQATETQPAENPVPAEPPAASEPEPESAGPSVPPRTR